MRLGIFGGTFDPVHLGHLAAAEEAAFCCRLQRVFFVPAYQQPLKDALPRASGDDRLAMLELAVCANPLFGVSSLELNRPAPSYTVDTLRAMRHEFGADCELYFLLGVDAANSLDRWRDPAELLRLARLVVMSRGAVRQPDWTRLAGLAPDARERITTVDVPNLDISSSDLRQRVASGRPICYQVPDAVREYIAANHLYQ
jgi:nicotinate-nucleotide adenylyltransferase